MDRLDIVLAFILVAALGESLAYWAPKVVTILSIITFTADWIGAPKLRGMTNSVRRYASRWFSNNSPDHRALLGEVLRFLGWGAAGLVAMLLFGWLIGIPARFLVLDALAAFLITAIVSAFPRDAQISEDDAWWAPYLLAPSLRYIRLQLSLDSYILLLVVTFIYPLLLCGYLLHRLAAVLEVAPKLNKPVSLLGIIVGLLLDFLPL